MLIFLQFRHFIWIFPLDIVISGVLYASVFLQFSHFIGINNNSSVFCWSLFKYYHLFTLLSTFFVSFSLSFRWFFCIHPCAFPWHLLKTCSASCLASCVHPVLLILGKQLHAVPALLCIFCRALKFCLKYYLWHTPTIRHQYYH